MRIFPKPRMQNMMVTDSGEDATPLVTEDTIELVTEDEEIIYTEG